MHQHSLKENCSEKKRRFEPRFNTMSMMHIDVKERNVSSAYVDEKISDQCIFQRKLSGSTDLVYVLLLYLDNAMENLICCD